MNINLYRTKRKIMFKKGNCIRSTTGFRVKMVRVTFNYNIHSHTECI